MKFTLPLLIVGLLASFVHAALENKLNGEYATITGKVTDVFPDAVRVQVNSDSIFVEMDDYSWDADGYKLVKGDRVVVTGRVDNDFLEKKKLEAGSVYVKNIDTYYYTSSDDEEDFNPHVSTSYFLLNDLPDNASIDLQGVVTGISARDFTLNSGWRTVQIDTKEMTYNPMDNTGFTQIDIGDRVRVSGEVDDDYFEGKEVVAQFLTEL